MQGRFINVDTLLHSLVAGLADFRVGLFTGMVLGKLADRFGNIHYFSVSFHELRFELAEKFFALLLDDGSVGNWVGGSLRDPRQHFGRNRRYTLAMVAGWACIEIGRIVQMAFRARQAVSGNFARRV